MSEINQDKINSLVTALEDDNNKKVIETAVDLNIAVKNSVGSFLVSMMNQLAEDSEIESIVLSKIIKDIKDDKIKTEALVDFWNRIQIRKNEHANTVLQFLKPSIQGENSVFSPNDKESNEKDISSASPEQLRTLDKLIKLLDKTDSVINS